VSKKKITVREEINEFKIRKLIDKQKTKVLENIN
jgi:hypothetical protein